MTVSATPSDIYLVSSLVVYDDVNSTVTYFTDHLARITAFPCTILPNMSVVPTVAVGVKTTQHLSHEPFVPSCTRCGDHSPYSGTSIFCRRQS